MCKLCELENSKMVVDNKHTYFYIMNNINITPQIVYGSRDGAGMQTVDHVPINYYPFCGQRLVNEE